MSLQVRHWKERAAALDRQESKIGHELQIHRSKRHSDRASLSRERASESGDQAAEGKDRFTRPAPLRS
jgi:hypothetical protein